MSRKNIDAITRTLNPAGEVKPSAAQALKAALNPPQEPDKPMSWLDVALELRRAGDAFEQEREARQAEAQAAEAALRVPPAQMLMEALRNANQAPAEASLVAPTAASPGGALPLNGAALLQHAIAGIPGATIDGQPPS